MQTIDSFLAQLRDNNVMVVAATFPARPMLWQMFCDTITPDQLLFPGRQGGHRWNPRETGAKPRRYVDGQVPTTSQSGDGYTRQLAAIQFSDSLAITYEALESSSARAIDRSADFVAAYTTQASNAKDGLFADILQKGTLSAGFGDIAGQGAAYNQSFPGFEDANPGKIYDGKPLFAASGNAHPFKHYTSSGSEGVNLVTSAALSTSTYDAARIAMQVTNAKDEQGQPISVPLTHIIVPSSNRAAAVQVLQSQNLPGSANNDTNPFAGTAEVVEFSRLTDSASASAWWAVSAAPGARRPFLAVDSGAPEVRVVRDDLTRVVRVICSHVFHIGVQDWRFISAHNKAAS